MLKTVAAILVVLIVAVLGFAATRPSVLRVQRAASIKAPPEKIFPLISDLHRWTAWSPYEKKDPALKRIHSGAPDGKGAVYEWEGNKEVGKGRMEITETTPPSRVTIRLDFAKPFEAHNIVVFTLEPKGGATDVRWAMEGAVPYFAKIIHLFSDMDSMVGKDFEAGLASMKAIAEKYAADPR